jgi:hypothetical protein
MELGPCSSRFRGKGFGYHSDVVPLLLDLLEPPPVKPGMAPARHHGRKTLKRFARFRETQVQLSAFEKEFRHHRVTIRAQTEAMQAHQTKLGDIRDIHRRHPGIAAGLEKFAFQGQDQPGSDETFRRETSPKG